MVAQSVIVLFWRRINRLLTPIIIWTWTIWKSTPTNHLPSQPLDYVFFQVFWSHACLWIASNTIDNSDFVSEVILCSCRKVFPEILSLTKWKCWKVVNWQCALGICPEKMAVICGNGEFQTLSSIWFFCCRWPFAPFKWWFFAATTQTPWKPFRMQLIYGMV